MERKKKPDPDSDSDSPSDVDPTIKLFNDLAIVDQAVERIINLYKGRETESWGVSHITRSVIIALTLWRHFQPLEVCLAGLFYGALNDLPRYGHKSLVRDTNRRTARLVMEITELNAPGGVKDKKLNWRARKEDVLARFPGMSTEAKMIFTAVNINYLSSLINYRRDNGRAIWSKLNASEQEMGWYYESFSQLLAIHYRHPISAYYHKLLSEAKAERLFKW